MRFESRNSGNSYLVFDYFLCFLGNSTLRNSVSFINGLLHFNLLKHSFLFINTHRVYTHLQTNTQVHSKMLSYARVLITYNLNSNTYI